MDVSTVTSLIGQFGFPLVACVYMAWLCWKQQNTLSEFSATLRTIQDAMTKINDRLEHVEHSLEGFGKDFTD